MSRFPAKRHAGRGRWLVAAVTLLVALVWLARAGGQAPVLSLAEYLEHIEGAAARLAEPGVSAAELAEIQAELGELEQVALPAGVSPADDRLAGEIVDVWPLLDARAETNDAPPLSIEMAEGRARVLQNQLAAAPHDDTAARLAQLATILERPIFTTQESLAERVWRWIETWLRSWFPDWGAQEGGISRTVTEGVAWTAAVVAGIVLVLLAGYWLQGILRNFAGGREEYVTGIAAADLPPSAAAARAQAQAAAEAGDYRQAVRRLYLTALLLLDEQRVIAFDRSLTNRELLAALPSHSPAHPHLRPVVEIFDAVWYGLRAPDEPTYLRYRAEIDALDAVVKSEVKSDKMPGSGTQASGTQQRGDT